MAGWLDQRSFCSGESFWYAAAFEALTWMIR
jgi:hypothetical protein